MQLYRTADSKNFEITEHKDEIDLEVRLTFENNPQLKVTKRELKQLFHFATSGTHFIFKVAFMIKLMGY